MDICVFVRVKLSQLTNEMHKDAKLHLSLLSVCHQKWSDSSRSAASRGNEQHRGSDRNVPYKHPPSKMRRVLRATELSTVEKGCYCFVSLKISTLNPCLPLRHRERKSCRNEWPSTTYTSRRSCNSKKKHVCFEVCLTYPKLHLFEEMGAVREQDEVSTCCSSRSEIELGGRCGPT